MCKNFRYLLVFTAFSYLSGCGLEYGGCDSGENVRKLFTDQGEPLPISIQLKPNETYSYDLENKYYIGITTGPRLECEEIKREPLQVDSIKVETESIVTVSVDEQYFLNVAAVDTGNTSFTVFLTADLGYTLHGHTVYHRKVSNEIIVK